MRNIVLIAGRGCPGHQEGDEFKANHVEAKALVALGKATRKDAPPAQQYMTRDMAAQTAPAPVPAAPVEVSISTAARKLADEKGIDVSTVTGTGVDGKITVNDIKAI